MKTLHLTLLALALGSAGCHHQSAAPQPPAAAASQISEDPKTRYEAGKVDAARDIKHGRLMMLGWQRNQNAEGFAQLLKTKYGVEMSMQTGAVTAATEAYAHGYNEVASAELQRRHGNDVLDRIAEDAMKMGDEKIK
jgi:hypothetical protein